MIKKASDIAKKNFIKTDILNGIRRIQYNFQEEDIECVVAYDQEKLVGIVTKKELVGAHPNRIIADVMSDKYMCVETSVSIWEVKEIFSLNKSISVILVKNEDKVIGYITPTLLDIELGRHIDLLTGLYKSGYMFYNAYNIIRRGEQLTVVFIDLNNFGHIDKKYGHIVGDTILIKIANLLKENIDSNSYLCRYAGDEFAIVTSNSIDSSKLLAEAIVKLIDSFYFPNGISVSVSIGITGIKAQRKNIENVYELIYKLVNTASLLSTKAKQNTNYSIIIENMDLDAIA